MCGIPRIINRVAEENVARREECNVDISICALQRWNGVKTALLTEILGKGPADISSFLGLWPDARTYLREYSGVGPNTFSATSRVREVFGLICVKLFIEFAVTSVDP